MESFQQQQNNKIEFQGVRNTYPVGEVLGCYFTVPTTCKPEVGDWIGIFPVGWSTLGHCVCKKVVRPENCWGTPSGQYGKVEFEPEQFQRCTEQYYQFVYVKSGEYIRGASTPFMFVPFGLTNGEEQIIYKPYETVFGGKQQGQQYIPESGIQSEWFEKQPRNIEQFVIREMQGLQQGISGLEQYRQCEETTPLTTYTTGMPSSYMWQLPSELKWTGEQGLEYQGQHYQPHTIKKQWQSRIGEVQQMLGEQIRIEQAQRRLEQLNVIAQLKSCERHISNVQKRECEIKNYFQQKMQKQIGEFEQKVYNIMKLNGEQQQGQQPEHYVRKYEQLLKEKIELDQQKRIAILHKLRQTIKECERKLREVQTGEQQYYTRFHQNLKSKIALFETKFVQPAVYSGVYSEQIQQELREQLRQYVQHLIHEQRREQYVYVKAQKQLVCLVQEICTKLQNLECEAYSQLNIPKIPSWTVQYPVEQYQQGQQQGTYTQIQQLEQQLYELKNNLRVRMLTTPKTFEQLQCGEWIRPISQKLRQLEYQLRQIQTCGSIQQQQPYQLYQQSQQYQQQYEKRIQSLVQHIKFFERHMEVKQLEEVRLRDILSQLIDLEGELSELPQSYEQYQCKQYQQQQHQITQTVRQYQQLQQKQQIKQIVELCQYLQTIVREKISQLSSVYEQSPIECFIQTGNHQSWRQLIQYERKLVQLKSLLVQKQQYQHLQQRLVELEQICKECSCVGKQQEKLQEQIRSLQTMLEQHQQQLHQQFQQQQVQQQQIYQWVPEQYIQHQQKYEKLSQLVGDLECQLIEQCRIQSCGVQGQQQWQSLEKQQLFAGQQQVTLYLIQQRFEKLVQEFQRQMPETYTCQPRIELICQFLRQCVQNETLRCKPFFGQQLKEKIVEFETIVEQQQQRIQQQHQQQQQGGLFTQFWTTTPSQQQHQHQYQQQLQCLRQIVRQCGELKSQIQCILDDWVVVSGCEEDCNNNNQLSYVQYEPIEVLSEVTLGDLVSRQHHQQQQQFEEDYVPRMVRKQQVQQHIQQLEQFERQMENIETLVQQDLCGVPTTQNTTTTTVTSGLRQSQSQQSGFNVEGLISELESELVRLRLQKESPLTTSTGRLVLTPESVCDEITKIVGQSLLQTVLPTSVTSVPEIRSTIVKVCQQDKPQQQGVQQQTTQSSTVCVEPTPFGTQCLITKVQQQKETTQQQPQF